MKEIVYKPFKRFPFNFNPSLKKDIGSLDTNAVFSTAGERHKIVREILCEHKKPASEFLIHVIVEESSDFEISYFRNLITDIVKAYKSRLLDRDRYLKCPTKDERYEIVKEILLLTKKSAPESLMQDIAELTELYDIYTVKKVVKSMVKESKTEFFERDRCIAILKKAIDLFDKDEIKQFKFAQNSDFASIEDLSLFDSSSILDFDSDPDDELLTLPLRTERNYIIQETLSERKASADESLMRIMLELTLGYDETIIKNLVSDMVEESKTNSIDQEICLKKLIEKVHKYDKKYIAVSKLNQLATIVLNYF